MWSHLKVLFNRKCRILAILNPSNAIYRSISQSSRSIPNSLDSLAVVMPQISCVSVVCCCWIRPTCLLGELSLLISACFFWHNCFTFKVTYTIHPPKCSSWAPQFNLCQQQNNGLMNVETLPRAVTLTLHIQPMTERERHRQINM